MNDRPDKLDPAIRQMLMELDARLRMLEARGDEEDDVGSDVIGPGPGVIPEELPDAGEDLEYHFRPVQKDDTTITVHGGKWKRHAHAVELAISYQGGTYDGEEDITISGTCYLLLKIDDPLAPTTLSIDQSDTDGTDDDYVVKALAKVTMTEGVIIKVEPLWTGGDITDYYMIPDSDEGTRKSLDHNPTTNCLQLNNFHNSAKEKVPMVAGDSGKEYIEYVQTNNTPENISTSPGGASPGSVDKGVALGNHIHVLTTTSVSNVSSVRFGADPNDSNKYLFQIKKTTMDVPKNPGRQDGTWPEDAEWTTIATGTNCPTT